MRCWRQFGRVPRTREEIIGAFPSIPAGGINMEAGMVKKALFVRLEAKPGKEQEVESFLMGGLPLTQ